MINGTFQNTPLRQIACRVEAQASTPYTFTSSTDLVSVEVDRQGDTKYFGFGISQKATIEIRDKERAYVIEKGNSFNIYFNDTATLPTFYATDIKRNENNNGLTIVANDALHKASEHKVSEIQLQAYTLQEFVEACAVILGVNVDIRAEGFTLNYENGANFSGNETLREALNDVAEITHTIYFIDNNNKLRFADLRNRSIYNIDKTEYFTLTAKDSLRLEAITSATELGDNITDGYPEDGETQTIKNNAFLDLREDRAQLLEAMVEAIGGFSITPFTCEWRGNYLVELGDRLAITTKDNSIIYASLLNDTISYNGGYKQKSTWEFKDTVTATSSPATLGETLKETFAKVDKQAKRIDLVASEVSENTEAIASLQINTGSISATVSTIEESTADAFGQMTEEIAELANKVSATITHEEMQINIEQAITNGATKVETSTGFTFNEDGLTIAKSESEISTTITENGMTIKKGESEELLTANKDGVKAEDLHATTFLIIGTNSRFENYGTNRTGCFWTG